MEALAVELLEYIFTLACDDGGYTGCSLSLVSQYIRATSRAARFRTISLTSGSARQVAAFSSCFFAQRFQPGGTTARIRHLCLTSAEREAQVLSRPKPSDDKEQQSFSADVDALFRAVGPELYTLCLIHGHRLWPKELWLPSIGCVHLPELQELSIVGSWMKYAPADGLLQDDIDGCSNAQLPHLSRLHFTFTFTGVRTSVALHRWAIRAPRVTHLRISNLDYYATGVKTQLKMAVGEFASNSLRSVCSLHQRAHCIRMGTVITAPEDGEESAFPQLEEVLMQPHPPPAPDGSCGTPGIAYGQYIESLRKLERAAKRPFRLVPSGERAKEEGFKALAKRQWLERIGDGPGCWDVGQ